MASILEVMREYKHLTAKKRAEGVLPPLLEERLVELEGVVKASRNQPPGVQRTPELALSGASPPTANGNASGGSGATSASSARANAGPGAAPRPGRPSGSDANWSAGVVPVGRMVREVGAPPPSGVAAPTEGTAGRLPLAPGKPVRPRTGDEPDLEREISSPNPARQARSSGSEEAAPERPKKAAAGEWIDKLAARLPGTLSRRVSILTAATAVVLGIGVALMLGAGVPLERVTAGALPALLLICGMGWCGLYPLLIFWREHVASHGNFHISEPDFEARAPDVEPLTTVLTVLGLVLYIWLGGHTNEGMAYVSGMLAAFAFGLGAFELSAILALRPIIRARVQARALRQYLEGGLYHLNKGNAKRARRLLERAMDEAQGSVRAVEVARHLRNATIAEAEELRKKGHTGKAEELLRSNQIQRGTAEDDEPPVRASAPPASEEEGAAPMVELEPGQLLPPRLMRPEMFAIGASDPSGELAEVDDPKLRDRVRSLTRKGRNREAFELLVAARKPISPELAEDAARLYIGDGLLRSADAIYERMGRGQIPEFYKAVAAEWARETNGEPPADACLRLAKILAELGDTEGAARIACTGALSSAGRPDTRREAAALAFELCREIKIQPPVELLEYRGDHEAAARIHEEEGRAEDALRSYRAAADRAIERGDPPAKLIPLLSKVFLSDPMLPDRYLEPLAQHVLETRAFGPASLKILVAYRKRRKSDDRLAARLFELHLDAQQPDEAYAELELLGKADPSNPERNIKEHRLFLDRYPDHLKARAGYVRALLKLGRIDEAAAEVRVYLERASKMNGDPKESAALLALILDWGYADQDLRKQLGLLRVQTGKVEQGVADLVRYVEEGGRDQAAIACARTNLSERLAQPSGAPDYRRILTLGRFLISCGESQAALPHLEVVRASKEHRDEAHVLLARAQSNLGDHRKAVALLKEAIAGRSVGKSIDLHGELARVYGEMGMNHEATRIARALAVARPGFSAEFDQADDTARSISSDVDSDDVTYDDVVATEETERWEARSKAPPVGRGAGKSESRRPPAGELSGTPAIADGPGREEELLGSTLLPRYRLLRRLGSGGMGEVHLAEDVELGRHVAIKVLRRSLATDLFLAKFKEEARIVAQLAHSNIVAIYDLGQKHSWSYIVMEYVEGYDLATMINRSGGFERWRLLQIVAGAAEAMAYAHGRGVIHRDLKPANILVGPKDQVKVTDFGIAKVLQPDGDQETAFSAAGLQVGTVNYMAPEQLAGKKIDPRTDIYLLGTTLYVCLTGAFPYTGEAVAVQKLREDPVPVRSRSKSITADLDALVMRCLARRAEARFQSMDELAAALRKLPEARSR